MGPLKNLPAVVTRFVSTTLEFSLAFLTWAVGKTACGGMHAYQSELSHNNSKKGKKMCRIAQNNLTGVDLGSAVVIFSLSFLITGHCGRASITTHGQQVC